MEENTEKNKIPDKKKPGLLSLVCILTFIGSGLALLSNLVLAFNYKMLLEAFEKEEITFPGMEYLFAFPQSFYIWSLFCYGLSVYGAYLMWNLRKKGFHFYTVSQIAILCLPSFYVKTGEFPFFAVLFTLFFIFIYYRHLNLMH